jgi:hypothetical protein
MHLGRTLVSMLEAALSGFSPTVKVSLSTPDEIKDDPPSTPAVTIFLYHVAVCGEMRNAPRRHLGNGTIQRPSLPLDLHFLITPWANEPDKAYQIIGVIVNYLYDHAILTFGELQGAGVWSPDDTVEIVMESLPVEEHYSIWEPTDLPYRLSLTYLARVVGIDSAIVTGAAPVVVANVNPQVTP